VGRAVRTVKHVTRTGKLSGLEDVEGTRTSPSRYPKAIGVGDVQECGRSRQGKAGVEGMYVVVVVWSGGSCSPP
jgi:hypothetical protein